MSRAPWFKLWAADFLSDNFVDAMSAEQFGWYCMLLIRSWNHTPQGYLTNDEQLLSNWCRVADPLSFRKRAQIVLDRFTVTEDGKYLYHPKILEQVEHIAQVSEKRRDAGKKGSVRRQFARVQLLNKREANATANAEQLHIDSESDSESDKNKVVAAFELPVWVPEREWLAFEEMRRKIKKPLTAHARDLAIRKLETLMGEGHDPFAVLNQSILNDWQDLFPIRNGVSHGSRKQDDAHITDQFQRVLNARAARRLAGQQNG